MVMEFNLADLFESIVDVVPDREALISGSDRYTYARLDSEANAAAHWLAAQGVGPGDHVGLHLYNGAPYIVVMHACFKLRAVPININYRYVAHELAYLFSNADLVAVVTEQQFGPMVVEAAADVSSLNGFLIVEDESGVALEHPTLREVVASNSTARDFGARSGDDLLIIYTGGTTGMPRGVMWRQKDLFFAALQGGNPGDDPFTEAERVASSIVDEGRYPMNMHPAAPLIHGAAMLTYWIATLTGGKIVLVPGRSFQPEETVRVLQEEQIEVMNFVGDAMATPLCDVLEVAGEVNMENLLTISSAGAILSMSIKQRLERLLPDVLLLNNFGSSETGHQGTALYEDEEGNPQKPVWYLDEYTAVLDDDGNVVEPGSGGSGWLARTGHIPLGYYGDPEKTARTFVESQGRRWVIPGDMARAEADGSVTILGRGAVCINSGGEKVFPEEVEEGLKAHPAVFDALVVGVTDERWGQRVEAVVQLRPEVSVTVDDLDAHVRTQVAGYKAPRRYCFVEKVERQPSGKPDYKWALRVASGELGEV